MLKKFDPCSMNLTEYLFFTGKGGVGKTSTACATAVALADQGEQIMLVSTDPASNLQDVFNTELDNKGVKIKEVPNLTVVNLNPEKAAAEYRENVIAPYAGRLPEAAINNMKEQLSGSCTVEIAAFSEFSKFITDEKMERKFDHIIFDTAPTGHTLRMLQLPSAWSNFIGENTHGASCLGQLSGLEDKKTLYGDAVDTLSNKTKTTLVLVSRPEAAPLKEAARASKELRDIGINNQMLIINGILKIHDDDISDSIYLKQKNALENTPGLLKNLETYEIPLRPYNVTGIRNVRAFLEKDDIVECSSANLNINKIFKLKDIVDDLYRNDKKVIFTMGKGGVGKTTIAAAIALGLSQKGVKVHLTTTDPAANLKSVLDKSCGITLSQVDEKKELEKYKTEVLNNARKTMDKSDMAYIEEDLRSPCTQEIAAFRAFAEIVEKSKDEVVVIDTAPTGHTLLLLDSTESYNREIKRSEGNIPQSVRELLPKLKNANDTEVIIVTLAEDTPVYESLRLESDLERAGIASRWWVINSSMYASDTTNNVLKAKASNEIPWIKKVNETSNGNFALIKWKAEEIKNEKLFDLLG